MTKNNKIPLKKETNQKEQGPFGEKALFAGSRVPPRKDHRYTDAEIKIMEEEIELMNEEWYKEYMARINQKPNLEELKKQHAEKMKADGYVEHITKSGKIKYVLPEFKNLSAEEIAEFDEADEKINKLLGITTEVQKQEEQIECREFTLEELKKLRRAYIEGLKKVKTHRWFNQQKKK